MPVMRHPTIFFSELNGDVFCPFYLLDLFNEFFGWNPVSVDDVSIMEGRPVLWELIFVDEFLV